MAPESNATARAATAPRTLSRHAYPALAVAPIRTQGGTCPGTSEHPVSGLFSSCVVHAPFFAPAWSVNASQFSWSTL